VEEWSNIYFFFIRSAAHIFVRQGLTLGCCLLYILISLLNIIQSQDFETIYMLMSLKFLPLNQTFDEPQDHQSISTWNSHKFLKHSTGPKLNFWSSHQTLLNPESSAPQVMVTWQCHPSSCSVQSIWNQTKLSFSHVTTSALLNPSASTFWCILLPASYHHPLLLGFLQQLP
jgi:hypothetical protein